MSEDPSNLPVEYVSWLEEVDLVRFLAPDGIRVEGGELAHQDFRHASSLFLSSVRLDSPVFDRGSFGRFHASDTDFQKASFHKCIQMGDVDLASVTFFESSFARTSLHKAKLSKVKFVECDLMKTSFADAHLEDVLFERCRFERTFFSGAVLERVNVVEPLVEGPTFIDDLKLIGEPENHPFAGLATEPQL